MVHVPDINNLVINMRNILSVILISIPVVVIRATTPCTYKNSQDLEMLIRSYYCQHMGVLGGYYLQSLAATSTKNFGDGETTKKSLNLIKNDGLCALIGKKI